MGTIPVLSDDLETPEVVSENELLSALENLLVALNGPMHEITDAKDKAIIACLKARGEINEIHNRS